MKMSTKPAPPKHDTHFIKHCCLCDIPDMFTFHIQAALNASSLYFLVRFRYILMLNNLLQYGPPWRDPLAHDDFA